MFGRVPSRIFLFVFCLLLSWTPFLPLPVSVQAVTSVPLRGIVSIQFDDGALDNLPVAESLAVRNVPCSFAVVTSWVSLGHPTYLNRADLLHLEALGHSVEDHSTSHNPQIGLMSDADKDTEIRTSRNTLRSWGLDPEVWVAPGGTGYANWWCLLRETVARYYPFAVMVNGWNNANPSVGIDSVDAYRIGTYSPSPDLGWSVESVKAELAKTLGTNDWVVLKLHTTPDTVVTKVLQVVDWLVANDVPIVRVRDEAALWFYGQFDLPSNIFVDNGFTRDIDSNGIPDNCISIGTTDYFVADGRFGPEPLGGDRYLVVKSTATQFRVAGVSRGGSYTASFWAKALSPNTSVRCLIYQEKHAFIPANSGTYTQILFSLPDTSWHLVDSLVADGCNFAAGDSTELLRLMFSSYSASDSGTCIARPSVRLTSGGPEPPQQSLGLQCWPDPAAERVTLSYYLPQETEVKLTVFDVLGRAVSVLERGHDSSGPQVSVWDTRDANGRRVAPGIYFCRLDAATVHQTRKILILR